MLYVYRPPQTWMPFAFPQNHAQADYNLRLQAQYEATRRVTPSVTKPAADRLELLGDPRDSSALTNAEFETAKARVLASDGAQ